MTRLVFMTEILKPSKTNKESANSVAEEKSPYFALTPYYNRNDLTNGEKTEVGNYQDVYSWNQQKQDWSFPIPENWKKKTNCYVNNSCCRFENF